ncbi:CRISPR-associated protein Cas5 [Clostridium estertheticum]|uniref:CRISPR-associated protein Cas5 n=1 Tax=Clostridium estertheticum TaxID=238834 RepID=UPI001C0B3B5F|nr:CRISPR-associated protein Cas5 [Clostridium estertheticum]MBU3174307.1 CRISPR-associated protein Cas5 [Clostridium estertheticum]
MEMRKIEIVADFAHFKKPFATKQQFTYDVPPISTVIGILQNLFNKDIKEFAFGYTFKHDGVYKDLQRIYKEVNINTQAPRARYNKDGMWTSDVCEIQYLINPKMTIYTNLHQELQINECLNLGKTDCLAKVKNEIITMDKQEGLTFNQWTEINTPGDGFPERATIETKYNGAKGYYDIYTKLLKLNKEFQCEGYYDTDSEKMVYLWEYNKAGDIHEFK